MSTNSNDFVHVTEVTSAGHSLNAILHNLIVMQLEYALEEPHTIVQTPVDEQTIRNALHLIREMEDVAHVSTFHFHDDENKLGLAWHYQNSIVSIEVGPEFPLLTNGFNVTYRQSPKSLPYTEHASTYQVYSHQTFSRITSMELRYLLTHWHI